jgi:hypothetical protein
VFTAIQVELRKRITDAVRHEACRQIEYQSEWLGYLPYGLYHWIRCNGNDLDLLLSEAWGIDDLDALEQAGVLQKTDDVTSPDDEFERTITYLVNVE